MEEEPIPPFTLIFSPLPPNHSPGLWLEMAMQGQSLKIGSVPVSIYVHDPLFLDQSITAGLNYGLASFGHQLWLTILFQAQYSSGTRNLSTEEFNLLMSQVCQTMPFSPNISADNPPETPSFLLWPPTSILEMEPVISQSVAPVPMAPPEGPKFVLHQKLDFLKESNLELEETQENLGLIKTTIILLEKIHVIEFKGISAKCLLHSTQKSCQVAALNSKCPHCQT